MTRDDIIREMGWLVPELVESELLNRIERTVRLAEAAEREKQVGKYHAMKAEMETYKRLYEERGKALARPCIECGHVPAAIRARGEK